MEKWIWFPLLCCFTPLFGQDMTARTYEARIYGSAYVFSYRWHTYTPLEIPEFDPGPFSLALSTSKGTKVQELELGFWAANSDWPEYEQQLQQVHLRYENGTYLSRKILQKVRVRLGAGWQIFYQHREEIPTVSGRYLRDSDRAGLGMDFVSHFEVALRPRLFLDLSLGFLNVTYALNRSYSHNPALPERQRELTNYELDWLFLRQLRLGICYRL